MFFSFYDNISSTLNDKQIKKVTFNTVVNVILIPSRLDYYTFLHELWWYESDYNSFYTSASQEIRDLVKKHPNITLKNARKLLYQPCEISNENTSSIVINDYSI